MWVKLNFNESNNCNAVWASQVAVVKNLPAMWYMKDPCLIPGSGRFPQTTVFLPGQFHG